MTYYRPYFNDDKAVDMLKTSLVWVLIFVVGLTIGHYTKKETVITRTIDHYPKTINKDTPCIQDICDNFYGKQKEKYREEYKEQVKKEVDNWQAGYKQGYQNAQ